MTLMIISYLGFVTSTRGKAFWKIDCLTLIWIVWQERNTRIFDDNGGC